MSPVSALSLTLSLQDQAVGPKQDLEEEEMMAVVKWSALPLLGRPESWNYLGWKGHLGVILFSPPPAPGKDNLSVRPSCCNEPCFSLVLRSANLQSSRSKISWKHFNYVVQKEAGLSRLSPCLFSLVTCFALLQTSLPAVGRATSDIWRPHWSLAPPELSSEYFSLCRFSCLLQYK